MTMDFDPDEAVARDRLLDHHRHPPAIAFRVHKGESVKAVGAGSHDARHLTIGQGVIRVECREQHGAVYARP